MADVNLYYGQHFRKNHKNIFEEKIIENFGNENLTLKMAIFLFQPCPLWRAMPLALAYVS